MATDTQQIMDLAEQIGDLLKDHPAVTKYKAAQKAVTDDSDASRLMASFEQQLDNLGRQEAAGLPITESQQRSLQALQGQIVSHIKIKALNLAQVDFVDLLRKVSQTYQRKLVDPNAAGTAPATASAASGTRLVL